MTVTRPALRYHGGKFRLAPWIIAFPGLLLSIMVLSINILGDRLRDRFDPRLAARRAS